MIDAGFRRLCVVGAGGHAKVVIATAELAGWTVDAVIDDAESKWGSSLLGHRISGPVAKLTETCVRPGTYAIMALGENRVRRRLNERYMPRWAVIVHPAAVVHPTARLGEGTLVCAGAIVQPEARIGRHVIINTGTVIEHDVEIGDHVHVAPGCTLAGAVTVGTGAFIGAGSTIIPSRRVGAWAVVGAGTVVTRDVPPHTLHVGVPNRLVREIDAG